MIDAKAPQFPWKRGVGNYPKVNRGEIYTCSGCGKEFKSIYVPAEQVMKCRECLCEVLASLKAMMRDA